jgi:hypothetical protein
MVPYGNTSIAAQWLRNARFPLEFILAKAGTGMTGCGIKHSVKWYNKTEPGHVHS